MREMRFKKRGRRAGVWAATWCERIDGFEKLTPHERRVLFDKLETEFTNGDPTVILDAVEYLRISDSDGDHIPEWLCVALQDAVLVWLKQRPHGHTSNLLQRLQSDAEDLERWQSVVWHRILHKTTLTEAYTRVATDRAEQVGVSVSAGAIRKSCERVRKAYGLTTAPDVKALLQQIPGHRAAARLIRFIGDLDERVLL